MFFASSSCSNCSFKFYESQRRLTERKRFAPKCQGKKNTTNVDFCEDWMAWKSTSHDQSLLRSQMREHLVYKDVECLSSMLQDGDLSRNMPGKVKVSAPNLQAAKKK